MIPKVIKKWDRRISGEICEEMRKYMIMKGIKIYHLEQRAPKDSVSASARPPSGQERNPYRTENKIGRQKFVGAALARAPGLRKRSPYRIENKNVRKNGRGRARACPDCEYDWDYDVNGALTTLHSL